MQNIWDIYKFFQFVADKYFNGYISPDEVALALSNSQNTWQNRKISDAQQGNHLAIIALLPFKKSPTIISSTSGILTLPTDFLKLESVSTTINGVYTNIAQVFSSEIADAVNSTIYPIDKYPRYFQRNNTQLVLYPNKSTETHVEYYFLAPTPVIGYAVSGNEPIYDPLTSVQLTAAPQYWEEIIALTFPDLGVNLANENISQLLQLYNFSGTN